MGKKRQMDFHKTKLRPGKTLPRGRNVTNTSFKSKKIIMPNQTHKPKSELNIKDCIKCASRSGSVGSRENALNQLNNLILKSNFSMYLPDIFAVITKNILEFDERLRDAAVRILESILDNTTALQISPFFPLLTNVLACAMTNIDIKIKQVSLKVLNVLLKFHPSLLCTSMQTLKNLQGLISGPSYNTKSRKAVQKNNLLVSCGDAFYSQDWRIQVLAHMNMFLIALLENLGSDVEKNDHEENEVYWDCKSPLHLEIFAGGGLKPVDIEKAATSHLKTSENGLEDAAVIQEFVTNIVDVLSQIFIEEITDGTSKTDDDLVLKETINNLSVLFQVLSNIGEWVKLISNTDFDLENTFTKDLADKIFRNILKFPFIARGPAIDVKSNTQKQHLPCVRLNLAICYLYSAFILKPECTTDSFKNQVLNYLKSIPQMTHNVKQDSIPMLLKIVKIYLVLNKATEVIPAEFLSSMLNDMSRMMKINDDRHSRKLLTSFFLDLSLQIGDDCLMNSDTCFSQLLDNLQKMAESDVVDTEFLTNIKRIAVRKLPLFLDSLEKMSFSEFKDLLTHENEKVVETAVFLIYHMRQISSEFLQELSELIICDPGFPRKQAFMLIRLLTHRFSQPLVAAGDRINFTIFLLNTALDTVDMDKRWDNYDNPKFVKIWQQFEDILPSSIIPSTHWKSHSKLFEVCHTSLKRLPSYTVNRISVSIINELMESRRDLPVHCAIAILRLNNPKMMEGRYHMCAMQDLVNTVLHFLSVISSLKLDNVWYECNVTALMTSLDISRQTAVDLMMQLEYDARVPKKGIVIYYILRIIKFFLVRELYWPQDVEEMMKTLNAFKKNCTEVDISRQPLYKKVVKAFVDLEARKVYYNYKDNFL